jgi:hypothetical protein
MADFQWREVLQIRSSKILREICRVGCNKVNAFVVIDKGNIILTVHAFVENNRQTLLGVIETAEHAEHLIDDLVEDPGVVFAAGILSVKQRQTTAGVDKQSQANLSEMVFSGLAVTSLKKLGLRI